MKHSVDWLGFPSMPMCAQIRARPERCVLAREWRTELYPRRHTTAKFTYVQNPEKRKTHPLCVEYQKRHFIILHKLQAKNITNENRLHVVHHSRNARLSFYASNSTSQSRGENASTQDRVCRRYGVCMHVRRAERML